MCELVGLIEEAEKYLHRRLLVVTKEKDVNLLFRRLSNNLLDIATFFKSLSVFAYKTLHIPDEYEFFGFYGKIISNDNNTEIQELTGKDTFIKDILSNYLKDKQIENFNNYALATIINQYIELFYTVKIEILNSEIQLDIIESGIKNTKIALQLCLEEIEEAESKSLLIDLSDKKKEQIKKHKQYQLQLSDAEKKFKTWLQTEISDVESFNNKCRPVFSVEKKAVEKSVVSDNGSVNITLETGIHSQTSEQSETVVVKPTDESPMVQDKNDLSAESNPTDIVDFRKPLTNEPVDK